jgi:hypothetical protein
MFQHRANRHRSSFPATQLVGADLMNPLGDIFPVAPAIADIDVVDVEPDLPLLPEDIQPPDMLPTVEVASAEATPEESVDAVPDMAPAGAASIEPTLMPVEETPATHPATNAATAEPKVQVVPEVRETTTSGPAMVAARVPGITSTDAPPTKPKKVKKRGEKQEKEGLGGGAGKAKRPRRKSAKAKGTSDMPDLTASDERLPGYGLEAPSGAHSPP